jgi:hypothetical protein
MFASEMLEHYRFLYSDSLSEDHMVSFTSLVLIFVLDVL